jgi:hypothetical protein
VRVCAGGGVATGMRKRAALQALAAIWEQNYICVFGLDVGALGEELVDEAEQAELRRPMENGLADLRWGRGEPAAADGVGVGAAPAGIRWRDAFCGCGGRLGVARPATGEGPRWARWDAARTKAGEREVGGRRRRSVGVVWASGQVRAITSEEGAGERIWQGGWGTVSGNEGQVGVR